MKILIIGGTGQLGSDLCNSFRDAGHNVLGLSRADLDITAPDAVRRRLCDDRPELVINCSVFHPVDECETHPEKSLAVNALAVRDLAIAVRDVHSRLVHISSDYVFDGDQSSPYVESDPTYPKSVFGVSKVAGEQFVRNGIREHFIVRTSGLYGLTGSRVKKGNFVETMLRLGKERGEVKVVCDLRMAQTFTGSLALQILRLVSTEHYGTYHASDHGDYSWYEFAQAIFAAARMDVRVRPAKWSEMAGNSLAPRPAYSVLRNARLEQLGLDCMTRIDTSLQQYLTLRHNLVSVATA